MRKAGEESSEEVVQGSKDIVDSSVFPTVFSGLKGGLRMSVILLPSSKSSLISHNSMNTSSGKRGLDLEKPKLF